MTEYILNLSVAVDYLQQKRAELTVNWGCENTRIKDSFERKKNSHLACWSTSSFKLFHRVQTHVYSC